MSTMVDDPRVIGEQPGITGLARLAVRRLRQGELGAAPVVLGLVLIAIIFQTQDSKFLTALNITNLMIQIAPVGVISVGVVLVLLLGEINLAVGALSGFCAAVMAVLSFKHNVNGPLSVLAGIAVGTFFGFVIGVWRTKLQVPSFIITLAALIAFQGAQLYTLGSTGSVNLTDTFITDLVNRTLPMWLGWTLAVAFVIIYTGGILRGRIRRASAGLLVEPLAVTVLRIVVLGLPVLGITAIMSADRGVGLIPIQGVPLGVVIFIGFVVLFDLIMRRTLFGRYVFAVGGNEEAARRAGISVDGVRIAVFTMSGALCAVGGVLAASRLYAVNQSSGGGDVLLDAIAAAVIGGTSLFGGRGSVWAALLGGLVIGSIANGMDLLALESSVKFMITGGVLLLAVTIDAIARRGRQAAGRA